MYRCSSIGDLHLHLRKISDFQQCFLAIRKEIASALRLSSVYTPRPLGLMPQPIYLTLFVVDQYSSKKEYVRETEK